MSHYEGDLRAPESARFAIIASRWNARITDTLVAGARQSLAGNGITEDMVDVVRVPGAWEIPMAANRVAQSGQHAAIIALGCVVRGDTRHYEHVADLCAEA
jgi:6,7-dimethyl-8-ribityllumazine synthase